MKKIILFIFVLSLAISAGTVDTVIIAGPQSGIEAKAVIVLPEAYNSPAENFAVVYLLHGWSGSYRDWAAHTDLTEFADRYGFILVCPDGGYAGWYLDSPLQTDSRYQTYIAEDVISFVDQNFRTLNNPQDRFITGLSMGGHGAVRLLCLFPEKFAAAGSMSGVLELDQSTKKYDIAKLIGEYENDLWQKESCLNLVELLAGQEKGLLLDCGIEDRFIHSNRKVHQKLIDLQIEHDYYERPGGHSWDYWVNALDYHLLYFSKYETE